jgi:hypothetical protein
VVVYCRKHGQFKRRQAWEGLLVLWIYKDFPFAMQILVLSIAKSRIGNLCKIAQLLAVEAYGRRPGK